MKMVHEAYYVQKLIYQEIKSTASRLLILHEMMRGDEAISLSDLERRLPTVDKLAISRTLSLFLLHRLTHAIDDGSGALKYVVCDDDYDCSIGEEYMHFYCENCHRTFYLKHIAAPVALLPEGLIVHSISYVLKGSCPECTEKLK